MNIDERVQVSSSNKWRPEERVECDQILDVILKHAIPNNVLSMPTARTTKPTPQMIGEPKSASTSAKATDRVAQQESAAISAQGDSATKKDLSPGPTGKKRGGPRKESGTNQPGSETLKRAKATIREDRRAENAIGIPSNTSTALKQAPGASSSSTVQTKQFVRPPSSSLSPSPPPRKGVGSALPSSAPSAAPIVQNHILQNQLAVVDLTSEDEAEEELPLALISPNTRLRHKRLAHFQSQVAQCCTRVHQSRDLALT